jgi:putative FmdB family regulatory protein
MPIYGYTCDSCEHSFDALQKMSDPKLVECPECGKATLRKLLSAPKFRLKGGGWYETDFKTGDKRNLVGDPDTTAAKTGDKDKPAKQEDTKTKEATKAETTKTPADGKVKSA